MLALRRSCPTPTTSNIVSIFLTVSMGSLARKSAVHSVSFEKEGYFSDSMLACRLNESAPSMCSVPLQVPCCSSSDRGEGRREKQSRVL